MQNLDFQPKMVGRESELKQLQAYLDKAAEGQGSTIFISGEAGIGKTRLVNELKQVAQSKGFQVLSGNSMYESLTPFMPLMEALRSGGLESLFAEEAPRVEAVYLVTNTGLLIREVVREETELNPDLFVSMFTTVTDFLNESLSKLSGEEEKGTLNSLGYQNYRILIEMRKDTNLVVILTGRENEFLLNDMREILLKTTKVFKKTLKEWDGDEKKVAGLEELLKPLITSGKYDGIYYGKDDPKIRRNLLFENVSLGLTRYAKAAPTLLCIEDLQWIDPSSLALMHYIARNTRESGLFIMGTYRPEDVAAMDEKGHPLVEIMQLMNREDLYKKTELARLPKETINEFLSSLLGEIDFSEEFKNRIYKETDGNPLFVIQLIKYMIDEKIISEDEGTWKLAKDLKDFEIPSKIYNVIKRRLNRLEKEDRKVLDYASVIGETFTSSILTDVLNTNRTQLLEQLRGFEQIHRLIRSHDGNYKFDHAKIKEVLYTEIPGELRINYHLIIANSIEELNKDNLDEVIENLAFHYYQCKDEEKALHYLIKAAEKAKKEYSNEEAIRFYSESLELVKSEAERARILDGLGDAHEFVGAYDKSIEVNQELLGLLVDSDSAARVRMKLAHALEKKGAHRESISVLEEALASLDDGDSGDMAMVLAQLGHVYMLRSDYDTALRHLYRSLELSRQLNDRKGMATALCAIGEIRWVCRELDSALPPLLESLKIREKDGPLKELCETRDIIGFVHLHRGDLLQALEHLNRSLALVERIGDSWRIASSYNSIGVVYLYLDETDLALEFLTKSLSMGERFGQAWGIAFNLNFIGLIHLKKGDYDQATTALEQSLKLREGIGDRWGITHTYCALAEVYLAQGTRDRAREYCKQTLDLAGQLGLREQEAAAHRVLGMVSRGERQWSDAIENFDLSLSVFRAIGMRREEAESYFEFGLMWKAKGDVDKAKEHLNMALDIFKKLNIDKKAENVKVELEAFKTS